jgi:hypothetical protein
MDPREGQLVIDSWQSEPASIARLVEATVRIAVGVLFGFAFLALALQVVTETVLVLIGMMWFVEKGLRAALPN